MIALDGPITIGELGANLAVESLAIECDGLPATMSYNGTGGHQILITSAGLTYIYDTVAFTFAAVSTPAPSTVVEGA